MIGIRQSHSVGRRLMTIEGVVSVHDGLPGLCVRRGFAGEVSGVEVGESGLDAVEVERADRRR